MKTLSFVAAAAAFAVCASVAVAQAPAGGPPAGMPDFMKPPPNAPPAKSTPPGPYAVSIESYPSLATHTVYQPADLSKFGGANKLPIISWGNGGCARVGQAFAPFLSQIVSHGYLAIAPGAKDAALPSFARPPGAPAAGAAPPPGAIAAPSGGAAAGDHMLIEAMDWAIKQNGDKASPLYGKLDTTKIAVMGQSCGGLQAMAVSGDPRVTTTVLWNSGTFGPSSPNAPAVMISTATKESLTKLHAPTAYFIGGPTDIAFAQAEDDFKHIDKVPVFKGNLNVGHGGTFRDPGAGWDGEVAVAWLDWQLKGDQKAAKYFVGADCTLCVNPAWSVEKKNMK
jgi:dienelactone hydrolase